MGFSPLSYSDILAFFALIGMNYKPSEIDVILILDNLVSNLSAKKQKEKEKKQESSSKGVRSE